MRRAALALLAASTSAAAAATCGADIDARARRQIGSAGLELAYAARPAPIPLDRHFALDVAVCGAPVKALRVDAEMPAHRHGMNYRPTVLAAGVGRFKVQGLLFHMPGRWRLIFDVDLGSGTQRLTQEVDVE